MTNPLDLARQPKGTRVTVRDWTFDGRRKHERRRAGTLDGVQLGGPNPSAFVIVNGRRCCVAVANVEVAR